MAWEHRHLMRWGIHLLNIGCQDDVLEIGCGGGKAIAYMSTLTQGSITAIDYSETMVRQATSRSRRLVSSGRVVVQRGDVANLEFDAEKFDVAVAIESFLFWPEPLRCLQELLRVLKPGGRLGLVVDSSKESPNREALQKAAEMLDVEFYSGNEIVQLMKKAGFADASFETVPERGRGWLFVCGRKCDQAS
jgi:ubiquinone/menaquinone biosynthesis C-methylase UbiE